MTFNIDRRAFSAEISAYSEEIRALKRVLRARWDRPMAAEQRQLCGLKQRATELCALRAFSRGRLHLKKPPRDGGAEWDALVYHQRIVERLGPSYEARLEQSA